jgi:hypothetical protein
MRCQQDSESASGVLQILVTAPSSSLNYNIKMSKEILTVVRGSLTKFWKTKCPLFNSLWAFHFPKWKSRHFVFWNAPTSFFTFSHDAHTQWISCRKGIIRKKSNLFMKIEGFMSFNTLMPSCAQIIGHWPTALGACYFGNTPTLRTGRCKKRRICRKVGYPYVQSKLQHPWLLCIWQVHANQKIGTQHIATCFPNISLRFHWTTCTCLYNFLHVSVSNSPWLGFQHHPKVRFHFRYMFCSYVAGTCWCQVSFLGIIYWTSNGTIDRCFNHSKHGYYMFQSPKKWPLHLVQWNQNLGRNLNVVH